MFLKSNNSRFILIVAVLVFIAGIKVMSQDVRNIPGLTAPDNNPKGCVSCHKTNSDLGKDMKLSTLMASWNEAVPANVVSRVQAVAGEGVTLKGKHTFKMTGDKSVPEDCTKCHGKMKNAPAMGPLAHAIHLTGGKDNLFMTKYQGECTNCHKLDPAKGIWSIISGKESE